jgi:enamine deaminase RidA (YjgF/YER057c/UK114 family)
MTTLEPASYADSGLADRRVIFSPSIWEPQMGYARGLRTGSLVFIAGTVAADGEGRVQGLDAYEQTQFVIRKIRASLRRLDADLGDVVSTVTHLSSFAHFDDYARAFKEHFGGVTPVNTTVQAGLVRPDLFVEITATAVTST